MLCIADEWVKCDDDKMSNTTTEQILKLSGGGKFSKFAQRISSLCPNNDYEDHEGMVGQSFKSKKKEAVDTVPQLNKRHG